MAKVLLKESQIEELILFYLNNLRSSFFWKNPAAGFFDGKKMRKHKSKYAINGVSDVLGIYRGRFVALEIKTPVEYKYFLNHGERLKKSPYIYCKTKRDQRIWRQIDFQKKIKIMGGSAFFVSSIEDVQKALQN